MTGHQFRLVETKTRCNALDYAFRMQVMVCVMSRRAWLHLRQPWRLSVGIYAEMAPNQGMVDTITAISSLTMYSSDRRTHHSFIHKTHGA